MFSYFVRLAESTKSIKAISVKQPWANLIASNKKTIETRTWETKYRGPLLIVSSKKPDIKPAGCAVAVANLVDCHKMTKADEKAACCAVYDGAYSWVLENVRGIKDPFPVKGALKLFNVSVPKTILSKYRLPQLPMIHWKSLYDRILKEVFGNNRRLMKHVTKFGAELDPESSEIFVIFLQERGIEINDPDLIAEAFSKFMDFLSAKLRK